MALQDVSASGDLDLTLPTLAELEADGLVDLWCGRLASPSTGFSPATVEAYQTGLRRFVFVATEPDRRSLVDGLLPVFGDNATLRLVVDELLDRYADRTVSVTLSAVSSFAEILVENDVLAAVPGWPKSRRSAPDPDPSHYEPDEVAALMAAASDDQHKRARRVRDPVRDPTILQVLLTLGLRASELVHAEVSWLRGEGEDTILRVVGKGSKARVLPIGASTDLLNVVVAWLAHRRSVVGPTTGESPLFCRRDGSPLTYDGLLYLFNAWLAIANDRHHEDPSRWAAVPVFKGQAKLHACRHTAAFDMVRRGVPLNLVQGVLGHSNVATTSLYVKAKGLELRDALSDVAVPEWR